MATVGQHDGAQITGGIGANHRASEAQPVHIGNQARMINVGMRKDNVVDFCRIKTQVAVQRIGFQTFALVDSAIEQYLFSGFGGNQVLAAGYLARCTHKLDLHDLDGIS